jgi:transposase
MGNVLSDAKREMVVLLGRRGAKVRHIEAVTGIRRETVSKYLKAEGIAIRPPGGWGKLPPTKLVDGPIAGSSSEAKPANGAITDPGGPPRPANEAITDSGTSGQAKPANAPITESSKLAAVIDALDQLAAQARVAPAKCRLSRCEDYRDFIEAELAKGRNAKGIYQDLVSAYGYPHKYASVMRFVRKLRGTSGPKASGVILTDPGCEAQVDYGTGPLVRDPQTGKYRRTRLFVMTLGYSRKAIRLLTFKSSTETWARLHEVAFQRLGGALAFVVLDNLAEGVLKPDVYDPVLNPLYRDVLAHYGARAIACRVRDPDRKGKVESGVGHAQKTPLKGKRFESLEQAQAYLDAWEESWGDTRIHGTTKRQVRAAFVEEKPHLLPLPADPFPFYRFAWRTVHLNEHVEVDKSYYRAPPRRIGQRLLCEWNERWVRLIDPKTGELLKECKKLSPGEYSDRQRSQGQVPSQVVSLLGRMDALGPAIGTLCRRMHDAEGEYAVNRILGIRQLAKSKTPAVVEKACAFALENGITQYRFVKRYVERHGPKATPPLTETHPLIRELTEYRDLFSRLIKQQPPEGERQ